MFATEAKNDENNQTWAIVEGIPDLDQTVDYTQYTTALKKFTKRINIIRISTTGSTNDMDQCVRCSRNAKGKFDPNDGLFYCHLCCYELDEYDETYMNTRLGVYTPIIYIPYDKIVSNNSERLLVDGSAFIQFKTNFDAKYFAQRIPHAQDYPILQKTELRCYLWTDINRLETLSETFHQTSFQQFQKNRNFLWWLLEQNNERFRDQFMIRFRGSEWEETNVFWMDENEASTGQKLCFDASEIKEKGTNLTELSAQWSPNGSYLITFHSQGVQLWGGPKFSCVHRFPHKGVDHIAFSPNETVLITCNGTRFRASDGSMQMPKLVIWDVLTGYGIITVPYKVIGPSVKLKVEGWWPICKWSAHEQYMAKINSSHGVNARAKQINKLNIFEMSDRKASFGTTKIGGKSLLVDALFDVQFSPTDNNILAYTTVATKEKQSKVILILLPDKRVLKTQLLGSNIKAHLYWQSQGKYLAAIAGRPASLWAKCTVIKSLCILSVRDKQKSIYVHRIIKLGIVVNFAWEPNGGRFAIIHCEKNSSGRENVSIFRIHNGKCELTYSLSNILCNRLYWSPNGNILVLANIDRYCDGEIDFVDVDKMKDLSHVKHKDVTDIEWDPSGRYLITATTAAIDEISDNTKYIIWSFDGRKLFEHKIKDLYQILWRPRPKQLCQLTNEEKRNIVNEIKLRGKISEKEKLDSICLAERTYLKQRILKQIYIINNSDIEEQKQLWKELGDNEKERHIGMINKRNWLRERMAKYCGNDILICGYARLCGKEISTDIVRLIQSFYCEFFIQRQY